MADVTYVGRQAVLKIDTTTVGVAELATFRVKDTVHRVYGIGEGPNATDIKEDEQDITGSLKKAYIGATFYDAMKRNANGYKTPFECVFTVFDKTGAGPTYPFIRLTFSGCKTEEWGIEVPAKGGILVEDISLVAKTFARTTGSE